jgi:hypothetical protein
LIDEASVFEVKAGFNGAGIFTRADKRTICAFTEDEFECADDDGFARTRLTGDGKQTIAQFPGDVFDQGEVTDL